MGATDPIERRCACKAWDAFDCIRLRYGTASGYDPDEEDIWTSTGEACECECHARWEEENSTEDDR